MKFTRMTLCLGIAWLGWSGAARAQSPYGTSGTLQHRCFAELQCIGDTATTGGTNYVHLASSFFDIPAGASMPGIRKLRAERQEQFLALERVCNERRYEQTELPATDPWNADRRDMYSDLKLACYDPGVCSELGQGCGDSRECCDLTSMTCDQELHACVSKSAAGGCAVSCSIDAVNGTNNCGGAVTVTHYENGRAVAAIDVGNHAAVRFSFLVCDPSGWTFHVSDSPTCDGWSGDRGTFSNDAEVHLTGTTLYAYGNDYAPANAKQLWYGTGFVTPSGCSARTLVIADKAVTSASPSVNVHADTLLRLNPPIDDEGSPDALWYLGVNRTTGSAWRVGSGTAVVDICIRNDVPSNEDDF